MKWFEGSVADAVLAAKNNKRLFAVYIEGNDKPSETLTSVLNSPDISDLLESENFVSVKIKYETEEYNHFVDIYKHVPVPSLFVIGLNGVPTAIIHNQTDIDPQKVLQQMLKIISEEPKSVDGGNFPEAIARKINSPCSEIIKERKSLIDNNNKSNSFSSELDNEEHSDDVGMDSETTLETIVNEPMDITEEEIQIHCKRKRSGEETSVQENEIKKRLTLNDSNNAKQKQRCDEDKRLMQEIQQLKIQNDSDRQRILKEIEQDKEERLARQRDLRSFHQSVDQASVLETRQFPNHAGEQLGDQSHIQFRKPDGSTVTEIFAVNTVINDLRCYVTNNITLNFRRFDLAVAFPRHVFTAEENQKTLEELGLVPNAVVLILPVTSDPGVVSYVSSKIFGTFLSVISPLINLCQHIRESISRSLPNSQTGHRLSIIPGVALLGFRCRPSQNSETRSVPSSKSLGNIHTVDNNRKDNDDDKNNVWNGNSTQQSQ